MWQGGDKAHCVLNTPDTVSASSNLMCTHTAVADPVAPPSNAHIDGLKPPHHRSTVAPLMSESMQH
jgi:hypothetical protein